MLLEVLHAYIIYAFSIFLIVASYFVRTFPVDPITLDPRWVCVFFIFAFRVSAERAPFIGLRPFSISIVLFFLFFVSCLGQFPVSGLRLFMLIPILFWVFSTLPVSWLFLACRSEILISF